MRILNLTLTITLALGLIAPGSRANDDPRAQTLAALRVLQPKLAPGRDYVVATDGTIAAWTAPQRFTQPTPQQIAATLATIAGQRAAIEDLRGRLRARCEALTPGDQVQFAPIFAKLRALLMQGRVAEARTVVATMTVAPGLVAARDAMVAEFPTP